MAVSVTQLPSNVFAVPEQRILPLHDADHINLAMDTLALAPLTDSQKQIAQRNIIEAAKKANLDASRLDKQAFTDSLIQKADVLLDSQNAEQKEKLPPGILMRVRHRGTRADVLNDNNRIYPRQVLADAVDRAKKNYLPLHDRAGSMIMESPHPQAFRDAKGDIQFKTSLDNKVGRIINVWMDEAGIVWFDSEIFDTTKGRNIAALMRAGEEVGVSIRSVGNSVRKVINDSHVAVATFMDLKTWDYVDDPATAGSQATEILLADSQMQAITDGLQFNDPVCPLDGHKLNPFDPDQDNDVDFWECPECKSRYDVYNGLQMNISSNQNLYRRWDSPQWGADRAQAPAPVTDSHQHHQHQQQGAENPMSIGAGLTAAQVQQMITDATNPMNTFLQQQQAEQAATTARNEAMAFVDAKLEEIKANYPEAVINTVRQSIGTPQNKEQAQLVLDSALGMVSQLGAANYLQQMGFQAGAAPEGQARVEVNEPKPWAPLVDGLMVQFDRIDAEKGFTPDPNLRKHNQELVNKIINKFESKDVGYQRMTDSMNQVQAMLDSGASITTAQLLNQPTIQTAILMQKFQDLEATQFMMSDVFEGSEWRIPSESFQGAETIDPATLLYDIVVNENSPIAEAQIDVIWSSFIPQPRRNAISLTTDVIRAMETGPLKYNAPARAIYHIGKQAARKIDLYAYWDMALTSDEYNPLVVANESVTCTAVSNGTNVVFKGQLQLGGQAGQANAAYGANFKFAPAGSTPIVRPRTKQVITANGSVQSQTSNQITCKVGGTTLTLGGLDSNGNIVGTGAQYAINFETGDIYFVTGLGITPGTTDPIISYSAATNYDLWHTTMGTGYNRIEDWYNTLLQQISVTGALMGSSPRFNPANLALFSLNSSNYVRNASMFYKLASPPATTLNPTRNLFGTRDEIDMNKINAPWVLGDNRILLTQKNATRYGIQTPYKIEGPIQKQDPTTGNLLPVKAWYGEEFSCICTPQVIDKNGIVLNPVSRTIRIVP